jgi:hypothetical protein
MRVSELVRRWSPRQLRIAHTAKGHVPDVIASIDVEGLMQLRKRARERTRTINNIKYFNLNAYIYEHVRRALWLDLHRKRRRILDIGTGFGYFPYVCEFFSNTAVAIDVPGHHLFDDVTQFLGITKIHQYVEPFKPLTGVDRSFDLVTAFQVAFNGSFTTPWAEEEWSFFLADVFENVLKEGGEIAMELNYNPTYDYWLHPGARRAMKRYDARLFGSSVRIRRK